MNKTPTRSFFAIALLVTLARTAAATSVTFQPVPLVPGTGANVALGVSSDGSAVVGWASGVPTGGNERAFRWLIGQAPQLVGPPQPTGSFSIAEAVSANGSIVAGNTSANCFQWSQASGSQEIIPPPPSTRTRETWSVSADGGVVVGDALTNDGPRAYRWTPATGATLLPLPDPQVASNEAHGKAVSADGTRVVGWSRSASGYHGFVWSTTNGFEQTTLGLAGGRASYTFDASASGTTVLGRTEFSNGAIQAWLWSASNGYTTIPFASGVTTAGPEALSGDGSTMVGATNPTEFADPILWTAQTGTVRIRDLLTANGVDLTGWTLGTAYDVSFDGTTIVGVGSFGGERRGWVATVPTPSSTALALSLILIKMRRRARAQDVTPRDPA